MSQHDKSLAAAGQEALHAAFVEHHSELYWLAFLLQSAPTNVSEPVNQQEIAELAHELWQARGCPDGSPDEDWFRAEQELRSRRLKGL